MVTTVPSRFAVLSIEDDDYKPKNIKKYIKTKDNIKAKDEQQKNSKRNDKKNQNKEKKKKKNIDKQQWEQWKEKDSMVVEETYEQELHEAMLLSKLSYQEAQMEIKLKIGNSHKNTKKSNKKSKKTTMSLEQFNNLSISLAENAESKLERKNILIETEFFQNVDKEVSQVITREKEMTALKIRLNEIDDNISSAQLKIEIEKRDNTIKELEVEVEKLKEELNSTKIRNRRLCQILQQGKMKDKAIILAEVTKLKEIRDELTSEVTSLYAQLEQERSKSHFCNTDLKVIKHNFQLGRKAAEEALYINDAFDQGTSNVQHNDGSKNSADEEHSGRLNDVGDDKLKALVKLNPCRTLLELAKELNMFSAT